MSIENDVINVARRLRDTPGIDITKLAYLVSEAEWKRLDEYMHSFAMFHSGESRLPVDRMSVLDLEIRRRSEPEEDKDLYYKGVKIIWSEP